MSLAKKIQQGKSLRKKIQDSKKSCFSSTMDVLPGGNKKLQYIEEKIDLADETIQQLKVLSGNEEYCSLCKRFSQQSAQKSDKKREKRRQKEQRKKRAKKRKKSLEKNTRKFALSDLKIDTLIQRYISYTRWRRFSKTHCDKIQP